jgi:D-alanyl-D-alanine endopeptidase (penicillin-binding protein 7)
MAQQLIIPLPCRSCWFTLGARPNNLRLERNSIVTKKPLFWIGPLVLFAVIGLVSTPGEAAARVRKPVRASASKRVRKPARATTTPRSRVVSKSLYSATRSLTRKAKLARARSVLLARELAASAVPRYKFDERGDTVPDLRAAAAIIYNPETNEVLWEENSQSQRSIASITKMMTATVFLESNPDLMRQVSIEHSDVYQASTTYLHNNDVVTPDDLLHLLLIASDNAAARALARISPQGSAGFIDRMNEKAAERGLQSTHYADPSGLLSDNVSSAYDMARLITHVAGDERIGSIMRTPLYTVYTSGRKISFHSTNHLLGRSDVEVRGGKTGFISKAGYCLATLLRLPKTGQQVAVVVLGARSNAGRFLETRNLFTWLSSKATTFLGTTNVPQVQQQ